MDMDLPRPFTIREGDHRIHNPLSEEKLAAFGRALHLAPGTRILDLACGSGEMLCTWAREHRITGTGVDLSSVFVDRARTRAVELGVRDRVEFVQGDATGHVAPDPVDLAACVGATWIGDGVAGTVDLLRRSLRPGGLMLIGEPFWLREPTPEVVQALTGGQDKDTFLSLPGLLESFAALNCDVVEMMLADPDSWDRYTAAQWLSTRRWLDANPDDALAPQMRAELDTAPARYARNEREHLGWGVFALMDR